MMKRMKSEELVIRSIHSNLLYIMVAAIIIAVIVLFNFSRQGLLGPIRGDRNSNPIVIWSVSDHNSSGALLTNQLTGTNDDPRYDDEPVLSLQRNPDGSLQALPRYQGRLEYHAP